MRRPRTDRAPEPAPTAAAAPARIFGVVVPVPDSLSRVANRVRRRYDPNFPFIGPHVTVLPPRRLALSREEVQEAVARFAVRTSPFLLRAGKVDTFRPVMPVIYLGFRRGGEELRRLHRRLAREPLRAPESFPYVPHLTLGQDLSDLRMGNALRLARGLFAPGAPWRWKADSLIVVERTSTRRWIALRPLPFRTAPSDRRRRRSGPSR